MKPYLQNDDVITVEYASYSVAVAKSGTSLCSTKSIGWLMREKWYMKLIALWIHWEELLLTWFDLMQVIIIIIIRSGLACMNCTVVSTCWSGSWERIFHSTYLIEIGSRKLYKYWLISCKTPVVGFREPCLSISIRKPVSGSLNFSLAMGWWSISGLEWNIQKSIHLFW